MRRTRLAAAAAVLLFATACGGGASDEPTLDSALSSDAAVPSARELAPADPSSSSSPSSSSGGSEEDEDEGEPVNEPGVEADARPGDAPVPAAQEVACPAGGDTVGTADELTEALSAAEPGDVIRLRDGVYEGNFVASTSGSADAPIWLCGGRAAVLDAGGPQAGYVFHLDGATHWRLIGFTITNGQKGLMADGTVGTVIQDLAVTATGDEAVHLRRNSTDNLVIGNEISDTGNRRETFGEGVYIGTAVSNWCSITECLPDRSDRNVISGNTITDTTAEAVDIKEGTTGGLLVGNTFDGASLTEADSWVDVKGTAWTIRGNRGTNTPLDGFQTHEIEDRWGTNNLFEGNVIDNGPTRDEDGDPGYGIALRPVRDNVVACDNDVSGGIEPANVECG